MPSFAIHGINAVPIAVEVDCVETNTLETAVWTIVGLGDAAVKESRERVKAALKNSGFGVSQRRVIVNLAPADLRKEGSHFDLPIALSILGSMGRIERERMGRYGAIGELSLDGTIKAVPGALPMAIGARDAKLDGLLVSAENANEAAFVSDACIIPVRNIVEAVNFLRGELEIAPAKPSSQTDEHHRAAMTRMDFADVKGQPNAKRAMEVAASGGHNLVLIGPPGSGKTMLAKRLPTIMPVMTFSESIETTKIHSIAGTLNRKEGLVRKRPFRSPHHTASHVALVGGGIIPRPGEVSLAHNGVLFLDELPEFSRNVLEVLRQPLEDGIVHISRAQMSLSFPATFILCAAMNPCPCGYAGDPSHQCACHPVQIQKYRSRISGPLLDRIDLHVEVSAVRIDELQQRSTGEPSAAVAERVNAARTRQTTRFGDRQGIHCNAQMDSKDIKEYCRLDEGSMKLLENAMRGLNLSARAYDRILRVSRTIADLAGADDIDGSHISEAVQYRTLDRNAGV